MYFSSTYLSVFDQIISSFCDLNSCVGITTVRAFKKSKQFEDRHWELQDTRRVLSIVSSGLSQWMSVRLNLISVFFVAFTYLYCIYNRDNYPKTVTESSVEGETQSETVSAGFRFANLSLNNFLNYTYSLLSLVV